MLPFVSEPPVFALIAADALSAALCLLVALFFLRAHRMFPEKGYGALSLAFGVWSVGYPTVAVSAFHLAAQTPVFDALRAGAIFLGSVLIFLNYALRRAGVRMRTFNLAIAGVALAGAAYVALYLVPSPVSDAVSPLVHLPWVRLAGAFLLTGAAFLALPDIPRGRLANYRVPLALVLLAFERYTVAVLNFYGQGEDVLYSYPWRIAGLALLVRVAWPPRRSPHAEA